MIDLLRLGTGSKADRDRAPEGAGGFAGIPPAHQAICARPRTPTENRTPVAWLRTRSPGHWRTGAWRIPAGSRTPLAGVKVRSPGRWRTGTSLRARESNPACRGDGFTDRCPTLGHARIEPGRQRSQRWNVVPARVGFRSCRRLIPGMVLGAWRCRGEPNHRLAGVPHRTARVPTVELSAPPLCGPSDSEPRIHRVPRAGLSGTSYGPRALNPQPAAFSDGCSTN